MPIGHYITAHSAKAVAPRRGRNEHSCVNTDCSLRGFKRYQRTWEIAIREVRQRKVRHRRKGDGRQRRHGRHHVSRGFGDSIDPARRGLFGLSNSDGGATRRLSKVPSFIGIGTRLVAIGMIYRSGLVAIGLCIARGNGLSGLTNSPSWSCCRRAILLVGAVHHDPERVVRQRPLQCLGLIPR